MPTCPFVALGSLWFSGALFSLSETRLSVVLCVSLCHHVLSRLVPFARRPDPVVHESQFSALSLLVSFPRCESSFFL